MGPALLPAPLSHSSDICNLGYFTRLNLTTRRYDAFTDTLNLFRGGSCIGMLVASGLKGLNALPCGAARFPIMSFRPSQRLPALLNGQVLAHWPSVTR